MKRTLIAVTAWAAVMSLVAVGCGSMAARGQAGGPPGAGLARMHPAPAGAGNRSADPAPIRDAAPGSRLPAGCPAGDAGAAGVRTPGRALTRSLLPPGQPDAALRCLYFGLTGHHPFRLRQQQRLDASGARTLAASILAKPVRHPIRAQYMCPTDDGSAELVVLAYPGRPDADIWVRLNGCGSVTNGYLVGGSALP
jgi:hypothetical protein